MRESGVDEAPSRLVMDQVVREQSDRTLAVNEIGQASDQLVGGMADATAAPVDDVEGAVHDVEARRGRMRIPEG